MAKPAVKDLVAQIHNAKGNIAAVARGYHVSRTAVYHWINASKQAQEALAEERESMVDVAESVLYKMIMDEIPSAVFYTLNNSKQAKDRGWGPRQELTGSDGEDIKIRIEYEDIDIDDPEAT